MNKKKSKQSSQYDKIFRENIEAVIQSLVQNLFGITAVELEEIPDDLQHTKERKPDVLKKITDVEGNKFVLHIEFQVVNDSEMVYRMLEYYVMLARKYQLPIRQFVIFIGAKQPTMATKLEEIGVLSYQYSLLSLANQDYKLFLKSNRPEEVILSILANFGKESKEQVLKQIISRLEETTKGELALKRYFKQLRILAQLRKLEQKLKETIMDSIAKYIDEEKDVAFLLGLDKGKESFVKYLLQERNKTLDQIADITGVSVEFVKAVKHKLFGNHLSLPN